MIKLHTGLRALTSIPSGRPRRRLSRPDAVDPGCQGALNSVSALVRETSGVTGLETAIILISFVVISSVFAFAALSTGLLTADKSKQAIRAGLGDAQSTLEIKGGIVLMASTTGSLTSTAGSGTSYNLTLTPVLAGSESISSGSTTLTLGTDYSVNYDTGRVTLTKSSSAFKPTYTQYRIDSIEVNLGNAAGGNPVDLAPGETLVFYLDDDTVSEGISNFALTRQGRADNDNVLEAGEVFTISVNTKTFGLTDRDEFVLQIKPPGGAVIRIVRRVPNRIEGAMVVD